MTQEEILKNYMGMSFEKQVELYNLFKQTLKDNNKKEELIKLDGQFRYFFELKNDLYENTRIFAGLNSTQVRYVRYNLYSELLEDLKYLNEDNYLSEENKIKRHKYVASQENTEKYYLPKSISNSIVDEFINYFNTLDRQHQIEIVSNFTKMFDNNRDYNDLSNISYTKEYNCSLSAVKSYLLLFNVYGFNILNNPFNI